MADRYWVGAPGDTWDGNAGAKWATTSGGSGGAAAPTNGDFVLFDSNSGSSNVVVAAGAAALGLNTEGYVGGIQLTVNLIMSNEWRFKGGDYDIDVYTLQALNVNAESGATRSITVDHAGGGKIVLTGVDGNVWLFPPGSEAGLTISGDLHVEFSGSGGGGQTRGIDNRAAIPEAQLPSFHILTGGGRTTPLGASKDFDFQAAFTGDWGAATFACFGSLTLSSSMTFSTDVTMKGSSGVHVLETNGATPPGVLMNGVGSTFQLADDCIIVGGTFSLLGGTLDLNGHYLNAGPRFSSTAGGVREIMSSQPGGGIITTGTSFDFVWNTFDDSNLTVTLNSWTIEIAGNTASQRRLAMGTNLVWPGITVTSTTTGGGIDMFQSSKFESLSIVNGPQTVTMPSGGTITTDQLPSGTSGALIEITSAGNWNLVKLNAGIASSDYVDIDHAQGSPGLTWYMGSHSVDGGNNDADIIFEDAPSTEDHATGVLTAGEASVVGSVTVTGGGGDVIVGPVGGRHEPRRPLPKIVQGSMQTRAAKVKGRVSTSNEHELARRNSESITLLSL